MPPPPSQLYRILWKIIGSLPLDGPHQDLDILGSQEEKWEPEVWHPHPELSNSWGGWSQEYGKSNFLLIISKLRRASTASLNHSQSQPLHRKGKYVLQKAFTRWFTLRQSQGSHTQGLSTPKTTPVS